MTCCLAVPVPFTSLYSIHIQEYPKPQSSWGIVCRVMLTQCCVLIRASNRWKPLVVLWREIGNGMVATWGKNFGRNQSLNEWNWHSSFWLQSSCMPNRPTQRRLFSFLGGPSFCRFLEYFGWPAYFTVSGADFVSWTPFLKHFALRMETSTASLQMLRRQGPGVSTAVATWCRVTCVTMSPSFFVPWVMKSQLGGKCCNCARCWRWTRELKRLNSLVGPSKGGKNGAWDVTDWCFWTLLGHVRRRWLISLFPEPQLCHQARGSMEISGADSDRDHDSGSSPRYGGLKSTNGCIYGIPQNASGVAWSF